MKKINYLVKFFVVAVLAGVVMSCLKANNDFGFIQGGGYIIQEYIGETPYYYPYVSFAVTNGDLASGSVKKGDEVLEGNMTIENIYEIMPSHKTSLSDVNGTYTLQATSTEGKSISATLNFGVDTSKKLGMIEVVDLQYSAGKIILKVRDVVNATALGVSIDPDSDLPSYSRILRLNLQWNKNEIQFSNGVYTITLDFDSTQDIGDYNYVRISPIATYNSSHGNILMQGPGKVLWKGSSEMYEH